MTGSGDNTPARLLPFNLFLGKGIFLENWLPFLPKDPYYLQKFADHYISAYPLLPGVLAVPFYLPFHLVLQAVNVAGIENYYWISFVAEKLSASIFASLSVVAFFFLFNTIYRSRKRSLIFALIFAFATQTFSISSQHLWQHTVANLSLILSLYFLIGRQFIYSLLFAVLCLFARNIYIFYIPLLITLIGLMERKYFKPYILIALSGILIFISLNYYLYGLLIGSQAVSAANFNTGKILSNLAVLIASPARGLIFYTPFFIFAFASVFLLKKILQEKEDKKFLLLLNLIFLFVVLSIYSIYGLVDDGWVWGDRYLTDAAVPAVILSYYFTSKYKSKLLWLMFAMAVLYSVFTQIVGTFYYPKGRWDNYPTNISYSQERLWDFRDNPLSRNLALGPKLDGFYMLYYALAAIKPSGFSKECLLENLETGDYLGYKMIWVKFTNLSDAPWPTAGTNSVQIRQIFSKAGNIIAKSPISQVFLPPVVSAHSSVVVKVVVVPPKESYDDLIIIPAQISLGLLPYKETISFWDGCQIKFRRV